MPRRKKNLRSTVAAASHKRVGRFVRQRRLGLGLTQRDVMRALGYESPISVSEVERGRVGVPFKRIFQYADVLRVPRNEFLALVVGGIQSRDGCRGARIMDQQSRALRPVEKELIESFRSLPANCRTRIRKQIRGYLAGLGRQRRVLRGSIVHRLP